MGKVRTPSRGAVRDAAGRLVESWDGVGTGLERREALYTYDKDDRKLSLTDARGYRAEMRYDGHDRQSRWIFPSKTTPGVADPYDYELYRYDANGNRVSLRKRDEKILTYSYDALNRLVVKQTPGHVADVRYEYDLQGLQTAAWFTGNGWGVSNAWDGFGRLISTTSTMGGYSRTVSHQYDRDGRETELTFPDGRKFWTRRDGIGRPTEMYQGALGSTATMMTAFTYDAASHLARFSRRFGDATAYGYDNAQRLSILSDAFGGATGGDTRSDFLYNPAGQLLRETRTNDAYAWKGSVAADRGYTTNGQNQYTGTTSGSFFAHDLSGNLTVAVNPPRSTTYTYDAENRLTSASGSETATLAYDPLGRLFQVSGPAGTTQFLYDGDELVAEYNASGALLRRYVHGDSDDDPLFWFEGAGLDQPRFPHVNRQGSTTGTAGPGGALLWINTYDEYGIPGAGNQGRFQYTGQAWIPELGLYYYKARFYSPTLGRFMQVDPIGYDDQINLYAYVGNDPVNDADPTGLAGKKRDGDTGFMLGALLELGVGWLLADTPADKRTALRRFEDRVRSGNPDIGKGKGQRTPTRIHIDSKRHPEAARHVQDAQNAGHPATLTIDRANANARRRESLRGVETKPGSDRDEYPPAMFKEGGANASVRRIPPADNRGSGSSMGRQCKNLKDGDKVTIVCR